MIMGSLGTMPSASLNETSFGLYEPSGGSAPDIAGQGIADPIATIVSAAMLLRYSLNQDAAADAIEEAVKKALADGLRTIDLMPSDPTEREKVTQIGTAAMGDAIVERL